MIGVAFITKGLLVSDCFHPKCTQFHTVTTQAVRFQDGRTEVNFQYIYVLDSNISVLLQRCDATAREIGTPCISEQRESRFFCTFVDRVLCSVLSNNNHNTHVREISNVFISVYRSQLVILSMSESFNLEQGVISWSGCLLRLRAQAPHVISLSDVTVTMFGHGIILVSLPRTVVEPCFGWITQKLV